MGIQRYRVEFKDILERTLLPEGISNEEMKEKLLPLMKHVREHIPSRLFRYRECTELTIDAFDKDILFASTSDRFNDPYDCLFRYDKTGLRQSIMQALSKEYIFVLREFLRSGNNFPIKLHFIPKISWIMQEHLLEMQVMMRFRTLKYFIVNLERNSVRTMTNR